MPTTPAAAPRPLTRLRGAGIARRISPFASAVALLTALLLPGCSPTSFNVNIGPGARPLKEDVVLADRAATAKVALIDIRGVIADTQAPGLFGAGENPLDELSARLRMAEQDHAVRAVILRINSPGGTVTASDIMYHDLLAFRRRTGKPVVACLGDLATSGGYYVALAADMIVAQPTSVTGSVGVILQTVNVSDGLSRIGIHPRAVTSRANKDLANPFAPMREDQYAILQQMVDDLHTRFESVVRERRPALDPGFADQATDGRVVLGGTAVAWGMADRLGGVREAFESAKVMANVDRARLVKYTTAGTRARSPYGAQGALAPPSAAPGPGETRVNLINLELGHLALPGPNLYYIWTAAAP